MTPERVVTTDETAPPLEWCGETAPTRECVWAGYCDYHAEHVPPTAWMNEGLVGEMGAPG